MEITPITRREDITDGATITFNKQELIDLLIVTGTMTGVVKGSIRETTDPLYFGIINTVPGIEQDYFNSIKARSAAITNHRFFKIEEA